VWALVGVGALVLLPAVKSARLAQLELRDRTPIGGDGMSLLVARFERIRADLPRLGEVGYLSDLPDGRHYREVWIVDYHVARYALRPLRVQRSTMPELVVGNFDDLERGREMAAAAGLELVRDYGDGVMLLRSRR